MSLLTYDDRFRYLQLKGNVGRETFGFDRYLNQKFYASREWKSVRDYVIVRDNGCDLAMQGYEIFGKIIIHHMNPIVLDDLSEESDLLLNPDYLISTTQMTHNAIHYGDDDLLVKSPVERKPNDTCPWK